MAFNFLSQITQSLTPNEDLDIDRSSSVANEEGENGTESDIELDPVEEGGDAATDDENGEEQEVDLGVGGIENEFQWSSNLQHTHSLSEIVLTHLVLYLIHIREKKRWTVQKHEKLHNKQLKSSKKFIFSLKSNFTIFFQILLVKNICHVIHGLKGYPIVCLNVIFP